MIAASVTSDTHHHMEVSGFRMWSCKP